MPPLTQTRDVLSVWVILDMQPVVMSVVSRVFRFPFAALELLQLHKKKKMV